MSFDRLIQAVIDKNNPTVVGLDPKLSYLPRSLKQRALEQYGNTMQAAAQSLLWFNQAIIDGICRSAKIGKEIEIEIPEV